LSILERDVTISSPADLVVVLREVNAYVAQGRLHQLEVSNPSFPECSLKEISETGPWPDYIEGLLEDSAGYRYRLAVETYHGTGGSWTRL
jgi:hypothetical protein